jgi:hypothetical protein
VTQIRGRPLPEAGFPAGYAALVERYVLATPLPRRLAAIARRHHPRSTDAWLVLTPRHAPRATLGAHLAFALKWEGVDLSVLAALFKVVEPEDVARIVRETPTGGVARRLWFLYEWLTRRQLDIADAGKARAVPVVDARKQVALREGALSLRHRVVDNLPGTPAFCPMVRWTPALEAAAGKGLDRRAREVIGRTPRDLVARAAAFLLLRDSRSSFAIEGERPSGGRASRWAQAIGEAGRRPLDVAELERLQRLVIGDARFVALGLRREGGFVGTHDRQTGEPVPDHVSARAEDVADLVAGLVAYSDRAVAGGMDPVVVAAALAFGFVYVHPFADGNGRLHRWLVHHVLAAAGYNPPGLAFPVSAVILRRIEEYRAVLETHSRSLLPFVEWRATVDGNVEVLNETADHYRYFDATAHAEFLYSCVEQTVERDLPEEVRFLEAFDRFAAGVKELVDMPDARIELLRGCLEQGSGHISARARSGEFAALTDEEAARIETLYVAHFPSRSGPGIGRSTR